MDPLHLFAGWISGIFYQLFCCKQQTKLLNELIAELSLRLNLSACFFCPTSTLLRCCTLPDDQKRVKANVSSQLYKHV